MPANDSLNEFLRDAIQDHDAGASFSDTPTIISSGPVSKSELGVLPGHEVCGFIARGGMGAVYLARQQALEREVAVKVMTSEADSPEMAERFRREALVLGRLAHPNIVPVYDIGNDDEGQLFYTMKLVKGRTLQHIINDLRNEDAEALRTHTLASLLTVFRKVCDALAFAHSQGIIHRDLKPENVMVGEFGEVLVMDWGLAKKLGEKAETLELSPSSMMIRKTDFGGTMSGAVMGTPQYMSPEQAMGLVNELDARSDVFSLGGILYAILTLRPPVEGATLDEVLNKVRTGNIASPSAFGTTVGEGKKHVKGSVLEAKKIMPLPHVATGKVPAALSSVVMKSLTLDKTRRYQSVAEFTADIEAYQGGFATSAEHAGLGKQVVLLIKRNKGIFTTAAAAWFIITALAVWFVFHLRAKELRAIAGEESAKAAEAVAVLEKEAARRSSATANINVADAALRDADSIAMQAALDAVPEDLRDSTWGYLLDQSDTSIARIRSSTTNQIEGVAADPRRPGIFAVADKHLKVTVLELRTGLRLLEFEPEFTKTNSGARFRLAFSPDGERIAVGRDGAGGIVIHSVRDGKKLVEWQAPESQQLKFSVDGKLLLQRTVGAKSYPIMWDSAKGELRWKYEPRRGGGFADFTPDGKEVVTIGKGEELRLVAAHDGTLVRNIAGRSEASIEITTTALAMGIADLLAIADDRRIITILNWREGRIVTSFQHETMGSPAVNDLLWTPDGTQLVTAVHAQDGRQIIRLWNARTGALLRSLLGGSQGVRCVELHPLSGELLIGGPDSRAWSLTGAPAKWTLPLTGTTSIAFWGSDEVVVASPPPGSGVSVTVQKLQPDGSAALLWKPNHLGYRNAAVSADGQWAAVTYPRGQSSLLLRRSGDQIEQVADLKMPHQADFVRFSPSGASLVAFTLPDLERFTTATGKAQPNLERRTIKYFNDFAWLNEQRLVGVVAAHGRRLEAGAEEWVVLWDTSTGKILQTATHGSALDVLAAAPDGSRFAEAGVDKKVRIRDAVTLAVQQEFRAHDGPITALVWHPTRAILATASTDLSIRLWDLATGRRLEELRGPTRPPHQLSFSPSGHRIGAASSGDSTRVWEPESLNDKPKLKVGDWEDILAGLTPELVKQTGDGWRMDNGVLFSPARRLAALPLPASLAGASYTVHVRLRQLAAKEAFNLFLPVADRLVAFVLDGFPRKGHCTGLNMVDGKTTDKLPDSLRGKLVKDSEQHDLEVAVRLDSSMATITATLDGQPLYQWTGQTEALSPSANWGAPPSSLALGTEAADWVVSEVKVKRLK